nr:hypothetical protein [Fortiea sp. LEGE XX443]
MSEPEQQSLASGQNLDFGGKSDFFFQQTNIQTEADNNLNSGSESSTQTTKYNFSQITLGVSITFGLPIISFRGNKLSHWMNNLLKELFS